MRTLTEFNRGRAGIMGTTVLVLVVAVGQSFTSVPMVFASPSYYGQFANTGQLTTNDKVRITGVDVGRVQALEIDGDHVVIKFSIGGNTIGTESRLAVKTDTILGKKVLEIEPRGTKRLRPGGVLPLGQSTTPYQLYDAFFDVTKAATGWDIDTVKRSLNVLSQTVDETYPHLSPALDGLANFSDTIGKRDEEIKHLLAQANQVASVLGDRSEQVNRLLVNAKTLLAAFNERRRAMDALLGNISAFSAEVKGFIDDNPSLNPCTGAVACPQRLAGGTQRRPGSNPHVCQPIRRLAGRIRRVRTVLQDRPVQPAAVLDVAAVRRRRLQEAWYRPGGLLAQCRAARVPLARPQRHPVPQRRAAARASGFRRDPGSSGTGRPTGNGVFVRPGARRVAAAVEPAAVRGRRHWRVRRQLPRTDRRADVAAEPGGPATDTGDPDRRAAGRAAARRPGHTGAAADQRAARRAHGELAAGRPHPATVDVRAGAATGDTRA